VPTRCTRFTKSQTSVQSGQDGQRGRAALAPPPAGGRPQMLCRGRTVRRLRPGAVIRRTSSGKRSYGGWSCVCPCDARAGADERCLCVAACVRRQAWARGCVRHRAAENLENLCIPTVPPLPPSKHSANPGLETTPRDRTRHSGDRREGGGGALLGFRRRTRDGKQRRRTMDGNLRRMLGCAPKNNFGAERRARTFYICGVACAAKRSPPVSLRGGPGPGRRERGKWRYVGWFWRERVEMAGVFGGNWEGMGGEPGPGPCGCGPCDWSGWVGMSACGKRPHVRRAAAAGGATRTGVEASEGNN
jgi:hypothetical protein